MHKHPGHCMTYALRHVDLNLNKIWLKCKQMKHMLTPSVRYPTIQEDD